MWIVLTSKKVRQRAGSKLGRWTMGFTRDALVAAKAGGRGATCTYAAIKDL